MKKEGNMSLNQIVEEFLLERGALKVGFTTTESLAGSPPSTDLGYGLDGARSAVTFAIPFNREYIRLFLAKKDRVPHENDNMETNIRAGAISWEVADLLKREGYTAGGTAANMKYRTEMEYWQRDMHPDISHRYLAVRSGMGSYGWSGNVGVKGHGTAIILGTCVTDAELEPTEPEAEDEGFCDNCKLCAATCIGGMFDTEERESIELGGVTFHHAKRRDFLRCNISCGGFTGLAPSGKWSTWSPGRFEIPEDEAGLQQQMMRAVMLYRQRPDMPGGYEHIALPGAKIHMTCGNCQMICWGDKKETAKNLKLLQGSGCVLQKPDGDLLALPADEAREEFEKMDPDHRRLYV
jgi:epoxyqueuosine reductase QueG